MIDVSGEDPRGGHATYHVEASEHPKRAASSRTNDLGPRKPR
ncbi:hypothetical protein [Parafrankia elaeagni]|nr:hypothetical protein [Parafrankia elaeagni]